MNKEISFRTWDTKNRKFIDHIPDREYMLDSDEWSHHDMDEMGGSYPSNPLPDFNGRLIHQQFIGLKDKNDKEIYEGDFLQGQDYEHPVQVVFKDLGFGLQYVNRVLYFHECMPNGNLNMTIVGNIFENPEIKTV